MLNRPAHGIQSNNRIQYETTAEGRKLFREYWIHEWDGKGYDVHEHINDLDQAIKQALELGYNSDAKKLEQLRLGSN
jgi:DNA-binding PadR family transcriptional regulator